MGRNPLEHIGGYISNRRSARGYKRVPVEPLAVCFVGKVEDVPERAPSPGFPCGYGLREGTMPRPGHGAIGEVPTMLAVGKLGNSSRHPLEAAEDSMLYFQILEPAASFLRIPV